MYDFEVLADNVLPLTRAELETLRRVRELDYVARDIAREKTEAQRRRLTIINGGAAAPAARPAAHLRAFLPHQLAWDRLDDIRTLVRVRYGDEGAPPGRRNRYVFLAACFLAHAVTVPDLAGEVAELAEQVAPTWADEELRNCISAVLPRAEASARGESVQYEGFCKDARYTWSNARLLQFLEVTRDEERGLRTIIGEAEVRARAAKRERERRQAKGALSLAAYQDSLEHKRVAARLLRAQNKSFREIAAELGISSAAAHLYCKG